MTTNTPDLNDLRPSTHLAPRERRTMYVSLLGGFLGSALGALAGRSLRNTVRRNRRRYC